MRGTGLGEVADGGGHVLVRVDAVRRLVAGRVGPGGEDALAGLLGYARGKGWLSGDGGSVRARVERGWDRATAAAPGPCRGPGRPAR